MGYIAENKETAREWVCVESLLSIDGSKTVTFPHKSYYDLTGTGFTVTFIVQPGYSFRIGKKDVGGWEITHASGTVTFTAYNTSTSLAVSLPVLAGKKTRITAYYTAGGKIGLYLNNTPESKTESTGTITGDLTNTSDLLISGTGLVALLAFYDKELSEYDFERINNEQAIIPKVLHANCVGFWPMQERYGNKVYDCVEQFNYAKGTALVPNHGTLTGFSDTELGTTDKNTQTARVDFYSKAVTDKWDGSNNEYDSGLPELQNALTLQSVFPTRVSFPGTTVSVLGTDNWSMHWVVNWKETTNDDSHPGHFIMEVVAANGLSFILYKTRLVVFLSSGSGNIVYSKTINGIDGLDGDETWHKGITRATLQKVGTRQFSMHVNSRQIGLWNTYSPVIPNVPYPDTFPDFDLSTNGGYNLYNYPSGLGYDLISFGVSTKNYDTKTLQNLHNNGLLHQPTDIENWTCYYNFNSKDTSLGYPRILDVSGNGNHASMESFTSNQLNPAHADYVFKPINSLR